MGVSIIPIKVPALFAGQEFAQDKRDRFNVSLPVDKVRGLIWCDKAATLYAEESDDGTTWTAAKTKSVSEKTTADTGWITLAKRYYRFRLVNGSDAQSAMTLYQQIVGLGEYLSTGTQASVVIADHGIPSANPVPVDVTNSAAIDVQLKGSLVAVGGKNYPVSGGNTLRGKAADKPDAAAAHAVIPYCYYFSIDTGVVEATDGTSWVVI